MVLNQSKTTEKIFLVCNYGAHKIIYKQLMKSGSCKKWGGGVNKCNKLETNKIILLIVPQITFKNIFNDIQWYSIISEWQELLNFVILFC